MDEIASFAWHKKESRHALDCVTQTVQGDAACDCEVDYARTRYHEISLRNAELKDELDAKIRELEAKT